MSGSWLATQPPGRASRTISATTSAGPGIVDQQGPRVHQVEGPARQAGAPGVGGQHLDVAQPALARRTRLAMATCAGVGVQPDHAPARRDGGRQQVEDPARAAAEIDRAVPGPQPELASSSALSRAQLVGLAAQPGALGGVDAQRETHCVHQRLCVMVISRAACFAEHRDRCGFRAAYGGLTVDLPAPGLGWVEGGDSGSLGPLEVTAGGQPLALAGARTRAVLAMLLVHANQVVSADRLIEELWPGQPAERAADSLQVRLSELRKALRSAGEADRLVTRPPGYLLRVAPGELDALRFEQLAAEGDAALAAGDAATAAQPSIRPWACGAGLRWPASTRRPPPGRRPAVWKSSAWPRWSRGPRRCWPAAGTGS